MPESNTPNTLYLIPTPISRRKENLVLPEYTIETVRSVNTFIVEKMQTARSFLQWIDHPTPDYEQTYRVLNKKTPDHEIVSFLQFLKEGDVGLMSEAGAPGVADPGAKLVNLAHQNNYNVQPLVGPSSILLALMGSGMNGQSFAFHGYLPIRENERRKAITDLERESAKSSQTQIFMETPHRNKPLLEQLMQTCQPSTKLCIACYLTADDQFLKTQRIMEWKNGKLPDIEKKPCLFLLLAN